MGIKLNIILLIVFTISFTLGFLTHKNYHKTKLWTAYESGAWVVMMHHKTYGNYGSQGYRIIAYEWGEPQTEEEVKMLVQMAEEKWPWPEDK